MTLQGAIIHCDVPTEMGPTKLLLGSQKDPDGYLTYRRAEEQTRFEQEVVKSHSKKVTWYSLIRAYSTPPGEITLLRHGWSIYCKFPPHSQSLWSTLTLSD